MKKILILTIVLLFLIACNTPKTEQTNIKCYSEKECSDEGQKLILMLARSFEDGCTPLNYRMESDYGTDYHSIELELYKKTFSCHYTAKMSEINATTKKMQLSTGECDIPLDKLNLVFDNLIPKGEMATYCTNTNKILDTW